MGTFLFTFSTTEWQNSQPQSLFLSFCRFEIFLPTFQPAHDISREEFKFRKIYKTKQCPKT